jgi:hypothetical protein
VRTHTAVGDGIAHGGGNGHAEAFASGGLWTWGAGAHDFAVARIGIDLEPSVDRCYAFGEAAQAGAAVELGAADTVVFDLDLEQPVALCQCDRGVQRRGVPGDVRQRFGDDEVCGQLDPLGEPLVGQCADDLDGQRSPRGELLDGCAKTAICQHSRMDPARQAQRQRERDQALLGSVV